MDVYQLTSKQRKELIEDLLVLKDAVPLEESCPLEEEILCNVASDKCALVASK